MDLLLLSDRLFQMDPLGRSFQMDLLLLSDRLFQMDPLGRLFQMGP
jgi:hypothetical protein